MKASIISALPDVGAAMDKKLTYQQRFAMSSEEGGIVADRYVSLTVSMAMTERTHTQA